VIQKPTQHRLVHGDARDLARIPDQSVHLVVTSPPYWNLKEYPTGERQIGNIDDYKNFLVELDKVWSHCYRVLVPGGRVCCVVGDVCISRRNGGRHHVIPLHSDIQVRCRGLGFDNLTPILWYKVANIRMEASKSSRFLGKPYLPNGVVKNDIETIVMLRKPALNGKRGYRSPTPEMETESRIGKDEYFKWFQPLWSDVPGASLRDHPAPYPKEIAYRLIRMFSFAGDLVLDPFLGTGTTIIAAIEAGRNSIGVEIDPTYLKFAQKQIENLTKQIWGTSSLQSENWLAENQSVVRQ
jgi:site-specific DNA-methyltransferase (adenine-specific)